MIEFVLEFLFNSAQNNLLLGAEFVLALGLGFWGYKLYSTVKEPSDSWDEFLKALGVGLMAFAVLDGLITFFRLL